MAEYTITLTVNQMDALIIVLGTTSQNLENALEAYLVSIANSHIEQALDATFKEKTLSEKEDLLAE